MKTPPQIFNSLDRWWRRPSSEKWLLLEAYFFLFVARTAVRALPFKKVAQWCGRLGEEITNLPAPDIVDSVSWSITTASRYGFWNCKCLTQALAGKAMLRRRGIRSTLSLGLSRPGKPDWSAHAWLKCGARFVTGEKGHEKYTVVARFQEPACTSQPDKDALTS